MKLAHPLLSAPIEIHENEIPVLVIEHPILYRNLISVLMQQLDGEDGPFVLSNRNETLPIAKSLDLVTDTFHFSLQSKKISAWLKQAAAATESAQNEESYRMLAIINEWIGNIICEMDHNVTYAPLEHCVDLLDVFHLRIDTEDMSLPEQMLEYMRLLRQTESKKLFIWVNVHACLTHEELDLLYKSIFYEKLQVLLIESTQPETAHIAESPRIIDSDLCEIG